MARWGAKFSKGAASVQTIAYLGAAAASPRRAKIYDLDFGCSATPADAAFIFILQRCTSAGTGTASTPNSLDPADTLASTIVTKDTTTVDPTLTAGAFLGGFPLNQRASFRWVAAPYGELIIPATASNGIILGLSAATTTTFDCGAFYEEF